MRLPLRTTRSAVMEEAHGGLRLWSKLWRAHKPELCVCTAARGAAHQTDHRRSSHDERVCLAGSYDGAVFVWDLNTAGVVATLKDKTQVYCSVPVLCSIERSAYARCSALLPKIGLMVMPREYSASAGRAQLRVEPSGLAPGFVRQRRRLELLARRRKLAAHLGSNN